MKCQDLHDPRAFKKLRATSDPNDADSMAGISVAPNTEDNSKNWIHGLIRFSESGISTLSKADNLTKKFACFQALWFVTQVFSQVAESRAVTPLEVSTRTCAYLFSASIAYAAWWKKPQNYSMPLMIDCSD